jgi:hypothetical protein
MVGWRPQPSTALSGNELWRAFRDQPLDGLLVFPGPLKVSDSRCSLPVAGGWCHF